MLISNVLFQYPARCKETENKYLCKGTGQCISKTAVCNGQRDCINGADEQNCKSESFT